MESILLLGACSAVDALGKILTSSCTCLSRGAPGSFWGGRAGVELDDTSVVPVCDDSSPSSDGSLIQRNVHFSQVSTISILHKSESSHSAATTSTRSTFSAYDYEVENEYIYSNNAMPTNIKTFHSPSREAFETVMAGPSSNRATPLPEGLKPSRQQQRKSKDRHEQRHRCLGHTKRKQRVRKLLAEEVANRKRKSERSFDRD